MLVVASTRSASSAPASRSTEGGGTGALDAHHIQGVAGPLDGFVVVVDDGYVVILTGEIGRQGCPYFAGPYNENVQKASAFPKAGNPAEMRRVFHLRSYHNITHGGKTQSGS